jgi:hypothetical protein
VPFQVIVKSNHDGAEALASSPLYLWRVSQHHPRSESHKSTGKQVGGGRCCCITAASLLRLIVNFAANCRKAQGLTVRGFAALAPRVCSQSLQ